MLEDAYASGRENADQIRRDAQVGRERAETHTQRFDRESVDSQHTNKETYR
jgi:hypothetical protein